MNCLSIEPRTRGLLKGYGSLSFAKNLSKKYGTATKTGLDAAKSASKEVANKTAEVTREMIWNKIVKNMWNQNLCLMRIRELLEK